MTSRSMSRLVSEKGTVPNVIGMTRDEALKAIESCRIRCAARRSSKSSTSGRAARCIATPPRIGSTVPQPSTVRLTDQRRPGRHRCPVTGWHADRGRARAARPTRPDRRRHRATDSPARSPTASSAASVPPPTRRPAPGSAVTLTVSRPRAPAGLHRPADSRRRIGASACAPLRRCIFTS